MAEHGEYSPGPERQAPAEYLEIGEHVMVVIDRLGITVWASGETQDVSLRLDPTEALGIGQFITMHQANLERFAADPSTPGVSDDPGRPGVPRLSIRPSDAVPDPIPFNESERGSAKE